ncbi:MAG: serpin family protein [Clostridia bacterium]|nr:serpin family protein [Clostridia bacterium]
MKHSAIPILCAAFAALSGCTAAGTPIQTPSSPEPSDIKVVNIDTHDVPNAEEGLAQFSTQLFKECYKSDKNTLLSPFSVYAALSMAANGAKGQTQKEMLSVLGAPSIDDINSSIALKMENAEQTGVLDIANALFVIKRSDITMNETTVNKLKNIYKAEIFHEILDGNTENKINSWVNDKTHEMIPAVLTPGSLNESTVSVILNAIAFESKWLEPFDPDYNVVPYDFHNLDGTVSNVDFLTGEVGHNKENDRAKAFYKYYEPTKSGKYYAFLAILPNDDITIDDYVSTMPENEITNLLNSASFDTVKIKLPKFSFDTDYRMKSMLGEMGMPTAFDAGSADFTDLAVSNIGNNISIGEVIHKAHIELDEYGTKAAAVTAIIMTDNGAMIDPEPPKAITLDRPFVFAICDMDEKQPIFIGSIIKLDEQK